MPKPEQFIRTNLKPRHMRLLVALDDLRHVGRAADFLNVTQPAVSKALAELEQGLEVALFERGPKGIAPTPSGRHLIRVSRSVLRDLEAAGDELRLLRLGLTGRLRIGALPVAAPALAPRAAIRLQSRRPGTAVSLQEATADQLLPLLREGLLDVIVGTVPPASMSLGLESTTLRQADSVAVVCGMGHPIAARQRIAAADLRPYPIVMPPLGSIFRETVERALATLDLTSEAAMVESGSMTATNTYLRETHAIAFYSRHLASHYSSLGLLRLLPIAIPRLAHPIGAIWSGHAESIAMVVEYIDCLREVGAKVLEAPRSTD